MARLSETEIATQLKTVPQWSEHNAHLKRTFAFKDFVRAFAFMADVVVEAEALDHHPDWSQAYNKVTITLSTHDQRALTTLDFDLARAIDQVFARHQSRPQQDSAAPDTST